MKCPYCRSEEHQVLDSRPAREGEAIRRRRECANCRRRFTTFEQPERPRLFIVKRSGVREEFSSEKLLAGMVLACRKRPVSIETLNEAAERIENELFDLCEQELKSTEVGERVMRALKEIDAVAYVRFASVYRSFEDPLEFKVFVDSVRTVAKRGRPTARTKPGTREAQTGPARSRH